MYVTGHRHVYDVMETSVLYKNTGYYDIKMMPAMVLRSCITVLQMHYNLLE